MVERNPPTWMQAGTYSADSDRLVTGLLVDGNVDKTDGSTKGLFDGVVPPLDSLQLSAGGTAMQVKVSSGTCVISTAVSNPPGAYICYNQGDYTVNIVPANNQSRYDLVYAEVRDQQAGALTNEWRFGVVQGDQSPSPVTPKLPTGAIPIGRVSVIPASQNGGVNKITAAQIFDLRQFVSSRGGVHLTWGSNPNPPHSVGRLLYDASNKSMYISDGTKWDILYTYNEWLKYFATYRPRQVVQNNILYCLSDQWSVRPHINSTDSPIPSDVNIPSVQTASGQVKVSLLSWGRVDTDGSSAHFSVIVRRQSDGLEIVHGNTSQGISFYLRSWARYGGSFLLDNLPTNVDLNFVMAFSRRDDAGPTNNPARAYFQTPMMIVEPSL